MSSNQNAFQRSTLLLFFGSGACGLIYQTVWVRQLTLSFGISVFAISAVLAAFMGGLSIGAAWIGGRADRIANPMRLYGLFEIGIALYTVLLYFILAGALPALYRSGYALLAGSPLLVNGARFLFAFTLLVIPTTLMGGTLPLLGRAVARRADRVGTQLGRLYGINTLGAMIGAGLAGFWLLKDLGILRTTLAASAFNLGIGLLALLLSKHAPGGDLRRDESDASTVGEKPVPGAFLIYPMLFISGYSALAYEVMWNRVLVPYIHNSVYAFSTVVILFLFGVGLGSLLYARFARRWTGLRTLGVLQLILAAYVWMSVTLSGRLPSILSQVTGVLGTDSWTAAIATIAAATALIVLVPTLIMGITFPMATAVCTRHAGEVASRIGRFYTCSTLGNILGALVTGFVLIDLVGLRGAFAVAIAFNLLGGFALTAYGTGGRWRLPAATALAAATTILFLVTVPRDVFIRHFARMEDRFGKIIFHKEEASDTVMVTEYPNGVRWIRFFDGRGTAGTASEASNRMFGHIPMMLHPDPERVLSICFGVGNTLSALAQYRPERLVCVELSSGAIEAASYFPSNHDVLKTPGLEVVVEDGRNYLQVSRDTFDVIQLEPPEIHTASVVNLYTREFYELARDHLAENGILCQWVNVIMMPEREVKMLIRTFVDAFPECSLWEGSSTYDLLLIGSPEPIRVTPEELQARYDRPLVRADLSRIGVDSPAELLSFHVLDAPSLKEYVRDVPPISDDRTFVDYSVPQSKEAGFGVFTYQTLQYIDAVDDPGRTEQRLDLLARRQSPAYLIERSGDAPAAEALLASMEGETKRRGRYCAAMAHLSRGLSLRSEGKAGYAAEYRKALEIRPDYAAAHNLLGTAMMDQGFLDGAIEHLRRAVEITPTFSRAHNNLGVALARQGRYGEAIRHFREALRINPAYGDAKTHLEQALQARESQGSIR